jgi:hypothetical protein
MQASDGEVPAVRSALAATLKRNEALNKRNDSLEESLGLLSPLRIRWPGRHSPMPSAAISAAFLAPEKVPCVTPIRTARQTCQDTSEQCICIEIEARAAM